MPYGLISETNFIPERYIAFSGENTDILLEMLVQYIVGIYLCSNVVWVRGLNIGRICCFLLDYQVKIFPAIL